jgi:type IV secretion system protein VirD4
MLHPHHLTGLLIGLAIAVVVAGLVRLVIGNPRGARHRVRVLRWRIRLCLRPGPGYANIAELAIRWSRLRAVLTGGRSRPSLSWQERLLLPVTCYAVRLGRAHLGRRVIASMEDQTLVLAAPRTGKSGWLADRIIDHPGAVVTTTTRTDLLANTAALRAQRGPVHVFNPEGIGGVPSTFRWNPLHGCEQPAVALQRATSLTAATETRGMQDMAFWIGKASAVLACLLHAAALDQRTMTDVYRWAHGIDDAAPEQILSRYPAASSWTGPLREIRRPGRTSDSIRMTVTRALAWLADPAVAAATTPGGSFDVADFVTSSGTLYMIGTGREEAPIAPLFRAFAEYVHAGVALAGSLQPHGRLDPPMLMALDEVTQICPVPLPLWMADSAGKGILIVAVCHGLAQLQARWDAAGAHAIWDTAGIKVVLGGVTDPDTLDSLSRLCGEISLRSRSRTISEDGRHGYTITYQPVRILPPELVRELPDWRALIIRGNLSPVVVRLRMAWWRHDYRSARRTALMLRRSRTLRGADRPELPPPPDGLADDPIPDGDFEIFDTGEPAPGSVTDDDLRTPRGGPAPGPSGHQGSRPDTPSLWPPGADVVPRPRRPWEPPTDSGRRLS